MTSYGSGISSPAATTSTHPDVILLSSSASSPSSPSPSSSPSSSSPSSYDQSSPSSSLLTTRCDICSYAKSSERMFKTKRCSHPFCKRCIKKYVVTKIEEDSVTKIKCPKPSCERFIERGDCKGIISKKLSAKWKELLHEESDIHVTSEMDERKQEKMVLELVEKKKWMRCPECKYYVEKSAGCDHIICWCKYEFCYRCGNRWELIHNCIST